MVDYDVYGRKNKTKTWKCKKKEVSLQTTETQVPRKELAKTLKEVEQLFVGYWHVWNELLQAFDHGWFSSSQNGGLGSSRDDGTGRARC